MTVDEGRKATLRGRLVEAVRLIFVAVFGAVGYQLGTYATATTGGGVTHQHVLSARIVPFCVVQAPVASLTIDTA